MHNCIICKNENLDLVFNLGTIYPSTFLKCEEEGPASTNLALARCNKCHLVQLSEMFDLDQFYRQYWYQSGLNSSMVKSLKNVVEQVECRTCLQDGDIVIDIGCNDCTLFTLYSNKNLFKVGFDPALNLKNIAETRCNDFVNNYFSGYQSKAKVITAIAMFYDVLDPHAFLNNITQSLHEDGIFIVQMTDLLSMLRINAFDNICHEHMCVYSLNILNDLFAEHNLSIFDVEYNDVNGGSLRVYASFAGTRLVNDSVVQALKDEKYFLDNFSWLTWQNDIDEIGLIIKNYINEYVQQGKKVYILGASTKGNTLLQYFGINNELIPFAADVNADKFGLRTVATNIEIVSEKECLSNNVPDMFLVLPWHFRGQILARNGSYLDNGGCFLFPLPKPQVVSKYGTVDINTV